VTATATGELRSQLRARRRQVAPARRAAAERDLVARLESLPELAGPGRLATYVAADGELDPAGAVELLRRRGWTVHLPVVGTERDMAFVAWEHGDELTPNRYGIPEPPAHRPQRTAGELDVVLVPCVALDRSGNRLGFGAGFYDRALQDVASAPTPVRIGVVWDDGIVDGLDPHALDVPMHVVVTERRVLRAAR